MHWESSNDDGVDGVDAGEVELLGGRVMSDLGVLGNFRVVWLYYDGFISEGRGGREK